jgi:hypothetical protein
MLELYAVVTPGKSHAEPGVPQNHQRTSRDCRGEVTAEERNRDSTSCLKNRKTRSRVINANYHYSLSDYILKVSAAENDKKDSQVQEDPEEESKPSEVQKSNNNARTVEQVQAT